MISGTARANSDSVPVHARRLINNKFGTLATTVSGVLVSAQVQGFHPASFLSNQTARLREATQGGKAIAAVSGGVDSTTAALLAREAMGDNLIPVLIDTGFMREGEPDRVKARLASDPVGLKIRLVKASGRFLDAVKGDRVAESKRKKFRETFYQVLHDEAEKEGCQYLVQGTIAPDWIETQGGIKTQHNVLEQIGIDPQTTYGFKVLEPLSELYKDQVRSLAKHLNLPSDLSSRQPFPGPGLLVRSIGPVTKAKMQALKAATKIVEEKLGLYNYDQYFAGVVESEFRTDAQFKSAREVAAAALGLPASEVQVDIFDQQVTGVKGDERCYGNLAGVKLSDENRESYGWLYDKLSRVQSALVERFPEVTRVALLVKEKRTGGPLSVIIRAVSTRDFMTAAVSQVPWRTLKDIAEGVLEIEETGRVYYDLTPKPPATIEFE
jgi:GMP synthase (glutamine-hydrolysing)